MKAESSSAIFLRHANEKDMEVIFRWRNDPWIVSLSKNQTGVDFQTHRDWFCGVLDSDQHLLYVVESENGEGMGTVRFDRFGPSAEMTIYLLQEFTGRGLGVSAIEKGVACVFQQWPDLLELVAKIRKENSHSVAAFHKAGFCLTLAQSRMVCMKFLREIHLK